MDSELIHSQILKAAIVRAFMAATCCVLSVLCVIFWAGEREVLLDNFLETLICSYFFLRVNIINQLTLKKIRTVLKWSWIMGLDNSRYMDSSRTIAREVLFLELSCLICNDHLLNGSHGVRCWALIWKKITGMDGLPRWLSGKVSACQAGDAGSIPELEKSPGGGHGMATHSGILGQRSLGGYGSWSHKDLNVT